MSFDNSTKQKLENLLREGHFDDALLQGKPALKENFPPLPPREVLQLQGEIPLQENIPQVNKPIITERSKNDDAAPPPPLIPVVPVVEKKPSAVPMVTHSPEEKLQKTPSLPTLKAPSKTLPR